jgi:TonB family protein
MLNIKKFVYAHRYFLYSALLHVFIGCFVFLLLSKSYNRLNININDDKQIISISIFKANGFKQADITKKDNLKPFQQKNITNLTANNSIVDQSNIYLEQNQTKATEELDIEVNSSKNIMLDYSFVLSVGDNKKPNYPITAKINNWQGEVKLLLKAQNGKVQQVDVLKSSNFDILDLEAIKTAKTWQLGYDVNGDFIISIVFKLNKNN